MHNLLVLSVVISIVMLCYLACQCYLAYRRARRLNRICKDLYYEYRKTQGPQWAEDTLKDIIHKVVSRVDGTTSIYRTS